MFILLFYCDPLLFLLCEIQSLEYFEVYPMYSIILLFLGLLFISDIICRIESPLIVSPNEDQRLFDSHQLFNILNVLLVDASAKPEHHNDAKHHKCNVKHGIAIGEEREFHIYELKVLKEQDNRIEEVGS